MSDTPQSTLTEIYEQPQISIHKQPGLKTTSIHARGDWDTMKAFAENTKIGFSGNSSTYPDSTGTNGKVSALQVVRTVGGMADYTVSVTERETVSVWNVDFMEIQKPIRTWHADKTGSDKPDLAKLRAWERLGESEHGWEDYENYIYDTNTRATLTGETLTLAKMIREEGIETYAVYTPVLTRVTQLTEVPSDIGSDTGKIVTPTGNSDDIIGGDQIATLTGLASEWLKTADTLQGAMDGTFQRTETWIGAEKWNPNLYATATSS